MGPDCVKMAAYGLGAQPLADGQNILEKIDGAPERHQGGPPGFRSQRLRRRAVRKRFGQGAAVLGTTAFAATGNTEGC